MVSVLRTSINVLSKSKSRNYVTWIANLTKYFYQCCCIFFLNELVAPSNCFLECRINQYQSGQLTFKISNIFSINLLFLVQCAVSHHHGARRSSNRNSFTFFRLHCLYVLTRCRAGLCIGGTLAEFLAGHIHN